MSRPTSVALLQRATAFERLPAADLRAQLDAVVDQLRQDRAFRAARGIDSPGSAEARRMIRLVQLRLALDHVTRASRTGADTPEV